MDKTPDRQLDPDEHEPEKCEDCGADLPVDSISWCICDDCLDLRADERERQERNRALREITRGF